MRLKTVLIALFSTLYTGAFSQENEKTNVLIIMTDQWRAHTFGYAGNKDVKTPNIDNLAAQSINFKNAVTTAPVCSPSRASMLTGTFPTTHGVFMNDARLSPTAVTMGETFQNAGYKTGYIGKWHVDGHGRNEPVPVERRHGFEYWKVSECTHNYNSSKYFDENNEEHVWEGYDAIAQTDSTISFLERNKDTPFFFVLSYGPPHSPYLTAPQKYRDMYDGESLKMRKNVPDHRIIETRPNLAGYYAHCTAIDDLVGKLMNSLEELGLKENTIVLFTADHGEMIGTKGYYDKQVPFDESIRIPFLLYAPHQEAATIDYPANITDVFPTLADLSGLDIPSHVEGFSLKNCINNGDNPSKGAYIQFIHPFGKWSRSVGGREYRAIRTNRYTYVENLKGPWLLYDNKRDPLQQKNLANKPKHSKLQEQLISILNEEGKRLNDEFKPSKYYTQKWKIKTGPEGKIKGYKE